MNRPRINSTYVYVPVSFDRFNIPFDTLKPGTLVKAIRSPMGCPPAGTMGMIYVGEAETGKFIIMVCCNSLVPQVQYNINTLYKSLVDKMLAGTL